MANLEFIIAKFFSTVGPLGLFPFAQGTISSIFAASMGYYLNVHFGSDVTFCFAVLTGVLGWLSSKKYLQKTKNKDPSEVVIDEFSGQLIASSAAGISPFLNFLAFVLFRLFDILKPGIIKKVEKLKGATGIMMDDWIAGLFSAAFLILFSILGLTKHNWFIM